MNLLLLVLRWKYALGRSSIMDADLMEEICLLWANLKKGVLFIARKVGKVLLALWFTINILACLVFLLSCIAPYINPGEATLFAFFGLGLPIAFAMLGFLMLGGLFVNRKLALLPLFFLIIGSYNIHSFVPIFPQAHIPSERYEEISVMSWNVMNFDLLNSPNKFEKKSQMLALIEHEQPDVLMLQEFYSGEGDDNTREALKQLYAYHYFEAPVRDRNGHKKWGQATFSKFPIVNKERINFPNAETNKAMVTDILVCGQLVKVINVHLQSFHFQEQEYSAIGNLSISGIGDFPLSRFYYKLKEAFEKRGLQADLVAKHIGRSEMPTIVGGDFNDTPNSYAYRTLSSGMQDAFWQSGKGLGHTYNGPIPGLRIDHILVDPYIKIQGYEVIEEDIADHFPIKSVVGIPL